MGWLAQGQSHFEESGSCPPPCRQSLKLVLQLKYFLGFGCVVLCVCGVWRPLSSSVVREIWRLGLGTGRGGRDTPPFSLHGAVSPSSGQVLKASHPGGLGLFSPLFISLRQGFTTKYKLAQINCAAQVAFKLATPLPVSSVL